MGTDSKIAPLRDWPVAVRLVLALFLISVGLGYLSALVQLHFQGASAGKLLPDDNDAVRIYHGEAMKSQLGRLLENDVSQPFNGSGSMRQAFTTKSTGWTLVSAGAHVLNQDANGACQLERLLVSPKEDEAWDQRKELRSVEQILKEIDRDSFCGAGSMRAAFFRKSRGPKNKEIDRATFLQHDAERRAMLEWVRRASNADSNSIKETADSFEKDWFPLTGQLAELPVGDFIKEKEDGNSKSRGIEIAGLFDVRCATCHGGTKQKKLTGSPKDFPMRDLDQILVYCERPDRTATPSEVTGDTPDRILDQREGERLALISWVADGADRNDYDRDRHELKGGIEKHAITPGFVETDRDGKRYAHIQSILQARCVRCHQAEAGGPAGQCPLDTFERLKPYTVADRSTGMSLPKLAQTTHVHLLGFSMLFALTGLVFSLTSYPLFLRAIFGPFTLLAQIADISCWWLGRADPHFARIIAVTGGLVAMGLMIQILGGLFNMFRWRGKIVVAIVLLLGVCLIAIMYLKVIHPQLKREASDAAAMASTRQ